MSTLVLIINVETSRKQKEPRPTHLLRRTREAHTHNLAMMAPVDASVQSGGELLTHLRLRLHAANLPRRGGIFKNKLPDTYAVVTSISSIGDRRSKHLEGYKWGETEVVCRESNPQWTETIHLQYEYGSELYFYVHVLQRSQTTSSELSADEDDSTRSFHKAISKSFGTALFEIGDILGTKHRTKVKRLRAGGCVFCKVEPVQEANATRQFRFQFGAKTLILPGTLKRKFFHHNPDVVLEIAKRPKEIVRQAWVTIYRSQPALDTLNPVWDTAELDLCTLCDGDLDRPLRFSVTIVKSQARRELMGLTETTLRYLLESAEKHGEILQNHTLEAEESERTNGTHQAELSERTTDSISEFILQRNSTKVKEVGRLLVFEAELLEEGQTISSELRGGIEQGPVVEVVDLVNLSPLAPPSLHDFSFYIEQGLEIGFCVAIDFTSSNGDPREPSSLHYQSADLNDYEETISSIGQALAAYSKTQEYAVWGFGAKFGGVVRHLFQVGATRTVTGVEGILSAYKSVFQAGVTMSGPTVFVQAIQAAAVRARKQHETMAKDSLHYTVLLVITDGIMDNYEETQRRLAVYRDLPLSVIFVGVGRSDFGSMYHLCSESHTNTTFVEFRRHAYDPAALGQAALRNVPDQICRYMQKRQF